MTSFKEFAQGAFNSAIEIPSSQVSSASGHQLQLKFNSKDLVTVVRYQGPVNPWLASVCFLAEGKPLEELLTLSWQNWDEAFSDDQLYWDLKAEKIQDVFFPEAELLQSALNIFRGRDYLYKPQDALICRCFCVREHDVLKFIREHDDPTPEALATATKAGMGCRSCVPQLTKWLAGHATKPQGHYYKEKSRANWLLEIDYMLSCFPEAADWKMEVSDFHGQQVTILFDKDVSQQELEETSIRLQDFLGAGLDEDLSFFLRRSLQR